MNKAVEQRGFLLLDGALGTRIEELGHILPSELWSGGTAIDEPKIISEIHSEYINSGADIITSASYQMSHSILSRVLRYSELQSNDAMSRTVELALAARKHTLATSRPCFVAASLGAYGASLADGSEYSGYCSLDIPHLKDFHRAKLDNFTTSAAILQADYMAFETIPCLHEVKAIASLVAEYPKHIDSWLSMACRSGSALNSGAEIEDAVRYIEDAAGEVEGKTDQNMPDTLSTNAGHSESSSSTAECSNSLARGSSNLNNMAIGVNCTHPSHVESLLHIIKDTCHKDRIIVAYPNRGDEFDTSAHAYKLNTGYEDSQFAEMAVKWYDAGARVIGGCCKTNPSTIKAVKEALSNYSLVGE